MFSSEYLIFLLDSSSGRHSTGGSSGASYGSTGGRGAAQPLAGASFGMFFKPVEFGKEGGHAVFPHKGGSGGGRLNITVQKILKVDGVISAKGIFAI